MRKDTGFPGGLSVTGLLSISEKALNNGNKRGRRKKKFWEKLYNVRTRVSLDDPEVSNGGGSEGENEKKAWDKGEREETRRGRGERKEGKEVRKVWEGERGFPWCKGGYT